MKIKFIVFLSYLIFFTNSILHSNEQNKSLKVGLLAPLSGEYAELGNSLLYSLQLALEEINDNDVFIIPRDAGFNDREKLVSAIKDIKSQGVKIIIGPINNEEFEEVKKFSDLIFLSPSNITPEFSSNIISVGISLESQLLALKKFIKKKKKNKTILMYPKNQYTNLIEDKLKKLKMNNIKKFKYNPDPQVLTGEIEVLTNYAQRKKKIRIKKKNV